MNQRMPHTVLRTTIVVVLLIYGSVAHAVGTAANTTINNSVTVDYVLGGVPGSASAGTSVVVEEILDASVTWQDAANVTVLSPSSNRILQFRLTNLGNGSDQFDLSVDETLGGDDFDPLAAGIEVWIDNGDDVFSAVDDTQYNGANGPVLDGADAANDSVALYVLADIPGGLNVADLANVSLTAVSSTAAAAGQVGNPGAEIPGGGDGGVRANVGAGGASATATGVYEVGDAGVSIDKSVEAIDLQGGNNPNTGATLRYTLVVNVSGSAAVDNLLVTDPVPANTTYVPASITLDGAPQTDAADAPGTDFSDFNVTNAGAITVDLSEGGGVSIVPPATFTIIFEVTID